jgi:hypothetical protein
MKIESFGDNPWVTIIRSHPLNKERMEYFNSSSKEYSDYKRN